MPRKSQKTQKPPLLFLEQSLDRARLQNEPEVRAALHPKCFLTELPIHENTSLTSWVSPQFEQSHLSTLPARRGRRKGHSATSILDRSSQLSRKPCPKTDVCRFPTLLFGRGQSQPPHITGQPGQTRGKKTKKTSVAAPVSTDRQSPPQPPRQQPSRAASPPNRQTSKRPTGGTPDVSASSDVASECPQPSPQPGRPTARRDPPGPLAATSPPRAAAPETPGARGCIACSPPDLDTPDGLLLRGGWIPLPSVHPLLGTPSQQQSQARPETLVSDTPEQDYGLRVTWRRRKGLMMALERGGHLSKVDTLVPV